MIWSVFFKAYERFEGNYFERKGFPFILIKREELAMTN